MRLDGGLGKPARARPVAAERFLAVRQRKRARVARRGERNGRMSRPSRRGRSPRPSERPARVTATPLSRRETAARAPAGSEERRSERGKARVGGRRRDATVTESGRVVSNGPQRRAETGTRGAGPGHGPTRAQGAGRPTPCRRRLEAQVGTQVRGTEAEASVDLPSAGRARGSWRPWPLERRLPEADALPRGR
ncbi:hypothetical protein ERJ75_001077400 [Trypanosoma vivax]|nr:hypothetical protein ERJ75_001077400 [Trypanosoma vivax]